MHDKSWFNDKISCIHDKSSLKQILYQGHGSDVLLFFY